MKLCAQSADSAKACTSNLSNNHTLYGEYQSAWCTTWHGVCTNCMHNRACLLHVRLLWSTACMHVQPCCKYTGYLVICVHFDCWAFHAISALPSYGKPPCTAPGRLHPCEQMKSSVVSHTIPCNTKAQAVVCQNRVDMPCTAGQSRLNQSIRHTRLYLF